MRYREGVLQLPVVREGFVPHGQRTIVFATGIRCPRCQIREIVYNGNYFCDGFTWDGRAECEWALPSTNDEHGTELPYLDLLDALVRDAARRSRLEIT